MRYNSGKTRPRSRYFTIKDICVFTIGSALTAAILLNFHFIKQHDVSSPATSLSAISSIPHRAAEINSNSTGSSILDGVKILVAVAAYDFSQVPHLEEALDGYFDLCAAGSLVDVVVFSTVAWPVSYIDILNTRFHCENPSPNAGFSITIHLKSPKTRPHLVDSHRELFYEKLEDYSLFIYTEDDIRGTQI
jgi:hypothetical protein